MVFLSVTFLQTDILRLLIHVAPTRSLYLQPVDPMSFHSRPRPTHCAVVDIFDVRIEPTFDFGSEEYQSFQERSGTTAFQGSRWLATVYREVAPALAAEPVTVTVRESRTGRLVLVLPLVRARLNGLTSLRFADFGVCDYLTSVYDRVDAERLIADATLPVRVATLLPPFDVISFTKLPHEDAVLKHLFPTARRARMRASTHAVEWDPDATWADWRLAKMDPSLRHELDIKRRRLARAGTPVFVLEKDRSRISEAFDTLRAFRIDRFKRRRANDILDNHAVFSFYRQIAIEGADSEIARTYCLYLSGEPVAVMFGLVHRRTFLLLLVGFDLVKYRRLSVGLLAIEDTLRASKECGDICYDFTIGDYPFKTQFGARSTPLYEWHVGRTIRGRLAVLNTEAVREAKRVLKPLATSMRRFQRSMRRRKITK